MKNREQVRAMLLKADDKLQTARLNYDNEKYDDAVSRAYYAVFHAISAALFSKDLHFSTHGRVIGQFNREFIKTELMPKDFTNKIQKLFDERQIGDYGFDTSIDKETALSGIESAENVIKTIKEHLKIE